MKASATTFKTAQTNTEQLMNQLTTEVRKLEGGWEGMAKTRFAQEWPGYQKTMTGMKELLGQISAALNTTAKNFEEQDRAAANSIGRV